MEGSSNKGPGRIEMSLSGELNSKELIALYDDWSSSYNKDYRNAGYNGPKIAASKLNQLVAKKNSRVLDLGCGTGRVAEELQLADRGFTNIEGIAASENSLKIARATGLYKALLRSDINAEGIPVEEESYDHIVSSGCFNANHLNQSVFPELCRVVQPGGFIVIVMREEFIFSRQEFQGSKLDSAIVAMCEKGVWNYVSRERVEQYIEDKHGIVFTFQKI